jgi:hypothetical protein
MESNILPARRAHELFTSISNSKYLRQSARVRSRMADDSKRKSDESKRKADDSDRNDSKRTVRFQNPEDRSTRNASFQDQSDQDQNLSMRSSDARSMQSSDSTRTSDTSMRSNDSSMQSNNHQTMNRTAVEAKSAESAKPRSAAELTVEAFQRGNNNQQNVSNADEKQRNSFDNRSEQPAQSAAQANHNSMSQKSDTESRGSGNSQREFPASDTSKSNTIVMKPSEFMNAAMGKSAFETTDFGSDDDPLSRHHEKDKPNPKSNTNTDDDDILARRARSRVQYRRNEEEEEEEGVEEEEDEEEEEDDSKSEPFRFRSVQRGQRMREPESRLHRAMQNRSAPAKHFVVNRDDMARQSYDYMKDVDYRTRRNSDRNFDRDSEPDDIQYAVDRAVSKVSQQMDEKMNRLLTLMEHDRERDRDRTRERDRDRERERTGEAKVFDQYKKDNQLVLDSVFSSSTPDERKMNDNEIDRRFEELMQQNGKSRAAYQDKELQHEIAQLKKNAALVHDQLSANEQRFMNDVNSGVSIATAFINAFSTLYQPAGISFTSASNKISAILKEPETQDILKMIYAHQGAGYVTNPYRSLLMKFAKIMIEDVLKQIIAKVARKTEEKEKLQEQRRKGGYMSTFNGPTGGIPATASGVPATASGVPQTASGATSAQTVLAHSPSMPAHSMPAQADPVHSSNPPAAAYTQSSPIRASPAATVPSAIPQDTRNMAKADASMDELRKRQLAQQSPNPQQTSVPVPRNAASAAALTAATRSRQTSPHRNQTARNLPSIQEEKTVVSKPVPDQKTQDQSPRVVQNSHANPQDFQKPLPDQFPPLTPVDQIGGPMSQGGAAVIGSILQVVDEVDKHEDTDAKITKQLKDKAAEVEADVLDRIRKVTV